MLITYLGRDYNVTTINFLQYDVCVIFQTELGPKMVSMSQKEFKAVVKFAGQKEARRKVTVDWDGGCHVLVVHETDELVTLARSDQVEIEVTRVEFEEMFIDEGWVNI